MTQNAFLGTIGFIKGNLMSNPELLDKGYSNETFYPGASNIPNSHTSDKTKMEVSIFGNLNHKIENNVVIWATSMSSQSGYLHVTNLPKLHNEDGSYIFNTFEMQIAYGRYDSTNKYNCFMFGFIPDTQSRVGTTDTSCQISNVLGQVLRLITPDTQTYSLGKISYQSYKVGIKYFVNFKYDAINRIASGKIWQEDEAGAITVLSEVTQPDVDADFGDKLVLASGNTDSCRGILYLNECWFKLT